MPASAHDWYAVHVRTRQEQFARDGLASRGIESILPSHKVKRQWSDRKKEVDQPLFPGYVFATFDFNKRLPVLQTPGVLEIVTFGGVATPIDPAEIEALRTIVESKTPAQKHPYLAEGSRVRVIDGPMRGHEGYFVNHKSQHRLVLTVSLLMRAISVEVDEADVEPMMQARPTGVR